MFKKLIQNPDWEFNLTGDVLLNGQKFIETLIADLLCIICNGVPKTERDIPKLVNGWFFRIKTETPWPSEFSNVVFHKPKRIMLKNLLTGEEKIFESKRQAIAYLEIDKKTLMKRLAENKPVKNWILKLL